VTDEDFEELLSRVKDMRMLLLFEEPCPLYEMFEEEELYG